MKHIMQVCKPISVIIVIFTIMFILGRISRINEISVISADKEKLSQMNASYIELQSMLTDTINRHKNTIDSLHGIFLDRVWLEYIVKRETNVSIPIYLPDSILFMMEHYRFEYKIPNRIYWRLINKESTFRFLINSSSGATGYMQVLPSTFKMCLTELGLDKNIAVSNKRYNILVGTYYIRRSYDRFNKMGYNKRKAWELTLSEYNAGIKPVMEAGYQIPNYQETINYVEYILRYYNKTYNN